MADQLYNPNIADNNQDVSVPGSVASPGDEGYEENPEELDEDGYLEYLRQLQNGGK